QSTLSLGMMPCRQTAAAVTLTGARSGLGLLRTALAPGQAGPVWRAPPPEPLGRRIDLLRIGCLLLPARPVARREFRHGVAPVRAYVGANHQDHARPVASSHERVLRPGRRVEEVPGSKASLPALDEQPALAPENEERLLIRLGVIDAALARLEDSHVDPELREFHRRVAVLVREPARRAPRLRGEPLGIAHVDDEPALGDGGEPGASVLKPRFGQEPDSRSPSDTSLTCASVLSPDVVLVAPDGAALLEIGPQSAQAPGAAPSAVPSGRPRISADERGL